jgi:hypothetical protein
MGGPARNAVVPEKRPDTDASVLVQIDKAIGSQSTQRLSLQSHREGLASGFRME